MQRNKTRDLPRVALFAALTALGAFLRFPLLHATVTLQFFFTAMAGLLLGARLAALSQLVYVALGLFGLPVFAAGGGIGYLAHPTCGFVLGLIPAAWVIGALSNGRCTARRALLAALAGLAVVYAVGVPYLALIVRVYQGGTVTAAALLASYVLPCLPGDALKLAACAMTAPRIRRALEKNF